MQLNQITITYSRTQSLPSYSNVKPGVTLTATLDDDDDFEECVQMLLADARDIVHGEIDNALERAGELPIFTKEPLYSICSSHLRKVSVIIPREARPQLDDLRMTDPNGEHYRYRGDWTITISPRRRTSLPPAAIADYPVIDCSDGDLSRIPPLPAPPQEIAETNEPKHVPFDYSDGPDFDEEE